MPTLGSESFTLPSSFTFSGTNVKQLAAAGSANQTLVTIVIDKSGSVGSFWDAMAKTVESVVKSCSLSPRADSLMLRLVTFDSKLNEVHGFRPLAECNLAEYEAAKIGRPYGQTALFDATLSSIQATVAYAKSLNDQDIEANGLVVIVTDGDDNQSTFGCKDVAAAIKDALKSETLESLNTILVGVNTSGALDAYLQKFKDDAGINQYVGIGDATERRLAKLADFVSKSVSATSQALGTGGPSQSVAFTV